MMENKNINIINNTNAKKRASDSPAIQQNKKQKPKENTSRSGREAIRVVLEAWLWAAYLEVLQWVLIYIPCFLACSHSTAMLTFLQPSPSTAQTNVPLSYLEQKRLEAQQYYRQEQEYIKANKAHFDKMLKDEQEALEKQMPSTFLGAVSAMFSPPPPPPSPISTSTSSAPSTSATTSWSS